MWAIVLVSLSIVFMGPSIGSAVDLKVVDKNCWIEVFDDDEFDEDDPHVKIQGPAEYSTLKDVYGRNWNNDIESVIVGSNAHIAALAPANNTLLLQTLTQVGKVADDAAAALQGATSSSIAGIVDAFTDNTSGSNPSDHDLTNKIAGQTFADSPDMPRR